MIGKLIGAAAGAQAARHSAAMGGTGGAILGALAVPMVRRMSIPALLALGAGGYVAKRLIDRRRSEAATPNTPEAPQVPPPARKTRRSRATS